MYNYYKMSAETLKFFENQTTEQIINWMLVHLSEDQIKMCLDAAGVPDTSVIRGKQPIPQPDVPQSVPISRPFGEGSSSDPMPSSAPIPSKKRESVESKFLVLYRKRCASTQYIIKSVSREGVVLYFEFKEIEAGDDTMGLNIPVDSVGWVKKLTSTNNFKVFCTPEDKIFLEILKEDNMQQFLNAPSEVMQTAADYPNSGLPSPIPIKVPDIPITPVAPVAQEESINVSEIMLKAIRIQQASNKFMIEYEILFKKGLTMYPIFIYNSEGDNVIHLSTIFKDGRIQLKQDSTNKIILNSKFKKIVSDLNENVRLGLYKPSGNIRDELNIALKDIPEVITLRISKIYDPIYINNFTYFGSLEDEDGLDDTGETYYPYEREYIGETQYTGEMDYPAEMDGSSETGGSSETNDTGEMNEPVSYGDNYPKTISSNKKKPSEMTIEEIEDRMRKNFGADYVRLYKPEKYVNSLGFTNIRYVKRVDAAPEFEDNETVVFSDFAAARDSEEEEDLLFD